MGVTTGHVVCRVRKALSVYINFYNNNLFKHFSMKKFFLFCMIALVGMCGLNSCSDDCNHDYIEYDYSKALVGTWTCMEPENEFAEALIIKADGSVEVTGLANGELFESKGTIQVKNNKMTYKLDNGDEWEGRFEMVAGESFSMVLDDELDVRYTYHYCENDLADEVVGMWVCNDFPTDGESDMMIETFHENGKSTLTGFLPLEDNSEQVLNEATDYKVVGDLLFIVIPAEKVGSEKPLYVVDRLIYTSNGTALGDILTLITYAEVDNQMLEVASTFLRINQSLNLAGKAYDYSDTYISNAEGADKDIPFLDTKFNFAHMDGSIIDKFLKSVLYNVQFPDAKTFQYNCLLEGQNVSLQLPMEVEGNKITIKMSSRHEAYRDVVVYAFQDVDGCQFHMYMPTASFENFFSNLSLSILSASGQVDINNPVHVDAVYKEVADAIESINVSIVMK